MHEREKKNRIEKVTPMFYFPSLVSYYDPSSVMPTRDRSDRLTWNFLVSSSDSLFSLASSTLSAALQQTLSRALQSLLLSIFLLLFPQSAKSLLALRCPYFFSVVILFPPLSSPPLPLVQPGSLHLHHTSLLCFPLPVYCLLTVLWQPSIWSPYSVCLKCH